MPCVVHAGLPKTATTLLQNHLFAQHPDVEFLGTWPHRSQRPFNKCRDATIASLFDALIHDDPLNPDLERAGELFGLGVQPALDAGQVPVWSWESLALNQARIRRARASNLARVFGACRVVLVVRSPLALVESIYFQHIKRNNVGSNARRGSALFCPSIDDWLASTWDRPGGAPAAHLDYAETVRIFADVFGRESVKVMLFEELVSDLPSFVTSLCEFAGISAAEGVALTARRQENVRWGADQMAHLQAIRRSPPRAAQFRFSSRKRRKQLLGLSSSPSGRGTRAQAVISPQWRSRIIERTATGNRWLEDEWGLPLSKVGYSTREGDAD